MSMADNMPVTGEPPTNANPAGGDLVHAATRDIEMRVPTPTDDPKRTSQISIVERLKYCPQQRVSRAERAGGRLFRHFNHRLQCYVHERLQRQQHWQLRRALDPRVSS